MVLVSRAEASEHLGISVGKYIHYAKVIRVQMKHAPFKDKTSTHNAFLIIQAHF